MTVLTTSTGTQYITVIPRFNPNDENIVVTLVSEDLNKRTHQITRASNRYTYENGILTITVLTWNPALVEQGNYQLTITKESPATLLYRGKVFVTDQTSLPTFYQASGDFVEYSGNNNEYITI